MCLGGLGYELMGWYYRSVMSLELRVGVGLRGCDEGEEEVS
jgi:hypothetical protein